MTKITIIMPGIYATARRSHGKLHHCRVNRRRVIARTFARVERRAAR